MNLAFGIASMASTFRPTAAPSQGAQNLQLAQGGGNDLVRDRIVRADNRQKSLALTGAKVGTRRMLDRAGVTKPASAKKT